MDKKNNNKSSSRGKESTKRRKKGLSPKTKKRLLNLMLYFIILASIGVISLTVAIIKERSNDDKILDLDNLDLNLTTILYNTDPKTGEIKELDRIHGTENRIWVEWEQIPKHVSDAFVAIEDKRYYTHNGVDIKRTLGSFVNIFLPIYSTQSGGSTITQQLIKNITNDWDKTWFRKITEIIRAFDLNKKYSKDKILAAYLNTINLASGNQGIRAAANHFFSKEVQNLTLAEAASLAAITKNPSRYNPYTKPEENKERQLLVLSEMLDQNLITKEQHDAAASEELVLNSAGIKNKNTPKSWFVDQVITDVIDDFIAKGMSKEDANEKLFNGGLRIYTTIDTTVQHKMDDTYTKRASSVFPKQAGNVQPESAMIIMGLDGQVKGLIGGLNKSGDRVLNRATSSIRQPGSTMKTLGAYTPAIDRNLITMSTIFPDQPIDTINGKPWPQNYYGYYGGNMTADEALRRSVNTIAVRTLEKVGYDISYNYLENKFHLSTLDGDKDKNASALSLGGMSFGVKPIELAAAYQVFANGGMYFSPHTYTKITNAVGETITENKVTGERVLGEETSYIMNRMLSNVMSGPQGTGNYAQFGGVPLIGKTGTTSDNKDLWFAGASAHYVGVIWWGFDEPKEMVFSGHPSLTMWKYVMESVHKGMPKKDFPISNNVVATNYCTISGEKATAACPTIMLGYYKKSTLLKTCSIHGAGAVPPPQIDKPFIAHGDDGNTENNDSIVVPKPVKNYSIIFDLDKGIGVKNISEKENTPVNLDKLRPTKKGYIFLGWYNSYDKRISGTVKMPKNGLKLKAKWKEDLTNTP